MRRTIDRTRATQLADAIIGERQVYADGAWRSAKIYSRDRLPVGALVARDGRALYANRTLLELIGYRDFAEFQAANALSRMFRDRDPHAMTAEDVGAVAVVRGDGQILSVDGHAQAIGWDGAPATLITLRRSLEAELRARMRGAESEAAAPGGLANGDLQAMLDRASDGAVTLDLAGRILSLNAPAESLFGYRQNEIAGESLLMLLAPPSHPNIVLRTGGQNVLVLGDSPGPTGGILLKTSTGAMIAINDAGIIISNGNGATIELIGSTVPVNAGALTVT